MTNTNIREWAAQQGIEVSPKGKIPARVTEAYQRAVGDPVTGEIPVTDEGQVADKPQAPRAPAGRPTERPPQPRRPGWWKRLTGKKAGRPARQSTEKLVGAGVGWLAYMADKAGQHPLSQALAFQAPVAGILLEGELRGTTADRMLQPLARLVNRGSHLGTLLALPILAQVITMRPGLFPQLYPVLVECLYDYHRVAGPLLKAKLVEREREREEFQADVGVSAEQLAMMWFTPPDSGPGPDGVTSEVVDAPA